MNFRWIEISAKGPTGKLDSDTNNSNADGSGCKIPVQEHLASSSDVSRLSRRLRLATRTQQWQVHNPAIGLWAKLSHAYLRLTASRVYQASVLNLMAWKVGIVRLGLMFRTLC